MSTIVQIDNLIAEQSTMVGGSELHHVLDLAPYGCSRFLVMKKRPDLYKPSHPFNGNFATERGTKLEAIAAEEYAIRTARKVRRVAGALDGVARRDPDFPYIGCHSDYEIVNDSRGPGVLSIKVPGREMFQRIKRDGVPDSWRMQLQYELSVWNRPWGAYGIFWADGWDLVHFDYEFDAEMAEKARAAVHQFWPMVENGPLPDRLDPKDRRCATCPFRTPCQGQAILDQLAKEGSDDVEVDVSQELAELILMLGERQEISADAEALVEETKEAIKGIVGSRTAVDAATGRVYFRPQQRETFKGKDFQKYARDLAAQAKKLLGEKGDGRELATSLLLESIANLPEILNNKFTNVSAFRTLRVYAK